MFALTSLDYFGIQQRGTWPSLSYTVSVYNPLIKYGGTSAVQANTIVNNYYPFLLSKVNGITYQNFSATPLSEWPQVAVNQPVNILPLFASTSSTSTANNFRIAQTKSQLSPFPVPLKSADGCGLLYFDVNYQTPSSTDYVSFDWNIPSNYKIGSFYNVFSINKQQIVPTDNIENPGIGIIPQRLVLYPTNIIHQNISGNDVWTMSTSAAILDTTVFSISGVNPLADASSVVDHINNLSINSLSPISSSMALAYELKALYATNNTQIIHGLGDVLYNGAILNFNLPCIPKQIGGNWQNLNIGLPSHRSPRIIRPESIEWAYSMVLKNGGIAPAYLSPYADEAPAQYNDSGYNHYNIRTNQQLFSSFNPTTKLLSSASVEYFQTLLYPYEGNTTLPMWAPDNNNLVLNIQPQNNTITIKVGASAANIGVFNLSARFIADLPYFSNTNSGTGDIQNFILEVIGVSSLSGVFVGASALSAIQPVTSLEYYTLPNGTTFSNLPCNNYYPVFFHNYTNSAEVSAKWVLKFPPHYYSYKASLAPTNGLSLSGHQLISSLSAEASFNYYLTSVQTASGAGYVTLSSWLYTNYHQSSLNLSTCKFSCDNQIYEDQIYFDFPGSSQSLINNLQLSAGYAPLYNQLIIPLSANRWFPAVSANQITLGYVDTDTAQTQQLNIRPKLSTFAGFTDCFKNIDVTISPDAIAYYTPITVLSESVGSVTLSISGLTTVSAYPFKDLNGTDIVWGITGPNIGVSSTNQPIISSIKASSFIPNSAVVLYDLNDTIAIFNYGVSPITVAVSSQALGTTSFYNVNTGISTSSGQSQSPLITLASAANENLTRTYNLQLTSYNGYLQSAFNEGTSMLWFWNYDNTPNSANVSAVFTNGISAGQPYNWHSPTTYGVASSLTIIVTTPVASELNIRNLNVYASINLQNDTAELTIPVDDFPSKSLANAVYSVAYALCANTPVFDISPNNYVFTRPSDGSNVYMLRSNVSAMSLISAVDTRLLWLSSGVGQTNYSLLASGVSSYQLDLSSGAVSAVDITLSATNIYAYGWGDIAHNIYQTGSFYIVPSSQFYITPEFLVYPPYTWAPSGNKLTLLDNNNYSISIKPSAYNNHINGTQDFVVSATPILLDVSTIDFIAGSITTTLSSFSGSVIIPINSKSLSPSGIPLKMFINSRAIPSTQSNQYTGLNIFTNTLYTSSFPAMSAQTTSASGNTGFNINPTIVAYPTLQLSISTNASSIDLNSQNQLIIYPSVNLSGIPLNLIEGQSSITYVISSPYWSYTQTVLGINPVSILLQNSPDVYEPLTYNEYNLNTYKVSAYGNLVAKISSSTFSAYSAYNGDMDLWLAETQTIEISSTSGINVSAYKPSTTNALFVSQYHQVTGAPITVQILPSPVPPAVSGWAYNMGDGSATQTLANINPVYLTYNTAGTMILSFTAFKVGGTQTTGSALPIHILPEWPSYNQEDFRSLSNTSLVFPYSLEEVLIQPNEFGVADIFNTAMTRLQHNLDYLTQNCKTLNPNTPKTYYGWLGLNTNRIWQGITWSTIETNATDFNVLAYADKAGFANVLDICCNVDYIYILDDNQLRIFTNTGTPQETTEEWIGYNSLIRPVSGIASIWVDQNNTTLILSNQITNKISIFNLDSNTRTITFYNSIGAYGNRLDPDKFFAPTYITKVQNTIYVLDYNNACVKTYTDSLGYKFTYYADEFEGNKIVSFSVHPTTGFVYILTIGNTLYIFEPNQSEYFFKSQILPLTTDTLKLIQLDESGDFFYATSSTALYKFASSVAYVGSANISEDPETNISCFRSCFDRRLLIGGKHYALVLEDYPSFYAIGEGTNTSSWSLSALLTEPAQFPTAIIYNQRFNRFIQNLKDFRRSINASFALVTEQTTSGTTYVYFALNPIPGEQILQKIPFSDVLTNNQILIGENEIHSAQTLNRPLSQLFDGLDQLRKFLSIEDISINGLQSCKEPFCWSWKAMSLAPLSLPTIFICGTNPVSFEELMSNFPFNNNVNTTLWKNASSDCCILTESPLNL
jgi:hypothetical protein